MKKNIEKKVVAVAIFAAGTFFALSFFYTLAFQGPGSGPGIGNGAIGVDSSNNISVGTNVTKPETKLVVLASSTDSTNYALKILQPSLSPIFIVRNDGFVGVGTSTQNGATLSVQGNVYVSGQLLGALLPASQVTSGNFGNGSGNFSFPASLGINTVSTVLPQPLSVYGNAYFGANLTIGKSTTPAASRSTTNLACAERVQSPIVSGS